ncbi:MAG TPA: thioredoxin domain-containing protein [Glaciihabitans sp.]|jgi:protein-disulfide isomerase|nr:thioredoxin domain-containing protein [Glaciihabitans sp.]
MTNTTPDNRLTKSQRREHARELARLARAEQVKRERRRRWITQGAITLGAVLLVGIITLVIATGARTSSTGPLNMLSDGITITGDGTTTSAVTTAALDADADPVATVPADGVANIVVYLDYLCPYCGQFETTNAEQITELVTAGVATLEVHPISILDAQSVGSRYSTRAANAAACVANYDPNNFLAVNTALFANQPAEGTSGLTNDELVSLLQTSGVSSDEVAQCISDETFSNWVADATDRALEGPLPNADVEQVSGTPTVLVNGVSYSGALDDADAFTDFITTTMGGTATE